MRHSLNAVERSSRQKRLTLSEMPNLPTRKIDQVVVRTNTRGSNVAPAQRNSASSVVDRPRRDIHKRSRAMVPMGGASSRFPRQDPSISPAPPRKRGRPTNEERLRRERKDGKRPSVPSRGTSAESVRLLSSRSSNRRGRPSDRPGSPKLSSSQSISGAAIDPELFESIQHQGPQRQTRKRPIDCEKLIKVIIGEGRRECATRIASGSANRCRLASARPAAPTPPAGTSTVPEVDDRKGSMQNREACSTVRAAHPPGRASPSPSRNGISRTSTGSARRFAARSVSTRTRARGTASSPGRRGIPTSKSCGVSSVPVAVPVPAAAVNSGAAAVNSGAAAVNAGAAAVNAGAAAVNAGAAAVAASGTETGASGSGSSTVIVPSFRLLNPLGTTANENSETSILQGESAGRPGGGNRDNPLSAPAIGARRKRPVEKVIADTGAKSIAPPQPRPYPPQSEVAAGAGGQGFLELTRDALVRSTHVFFGSDYDMDDDDEEFLQGLNGVDNDVVAEEDWAITRGLFEAMIERLERQESRARDTQVLVEATERLRADYRDATARVISLTQEADSMRFASDGNSKSMDARNGRTSGGDDAKGHAYEYEEDSDSDEGESQARIMRGRGPAILSAEFALPLLRSCVAKHRERDGDDKDGGGDASGAGASRAKKGKAPTTEAGRSRCGKEVELADSKLLAVFGYWTRKREAYGGPILRCFHAFMMNLWKRMDDPQREAEDLEEGRDPHASLEAFETLRSFRQDLDKARLVVDCVKRREKLKRSATRYANSIWKIVDETQDAPRASRLQVAPLSSSSSSSFSSSSQSRSFPAGLERPSTRGRAAAAAAAAEGLHDEEAFYGGSKEEENLQRQRPRAGSVHVAWAKSKAGCAEQEQAWNALARLPTREWQAGSEGWRGGRLGDALSCGRVTRGKKRIGDVRRRDEEGARRGGGGGASGLFVLRDAFAKRRNGVVPASGSGNEQELRSGGRGRRLLLDSAAAAAVAAPQAEAGEEHEHENHQDEEGTNSDTQVYHDLPQQQQQQQSVVNTRRKFTVVAGAVSHPHSSSGARSSDVATKKTAEEAEPQPEPGPPAEQLPTVPDGRRKSRRRRQQRQPPRVGTAVAPCLVPQPIASTHEGGRQSRHERRRESGSGQQPTEKDPEEEKNVVGEEMMSGKRDGGASNGLPAPGTRGIGGQAAITTSAVEVTQSPAAEELELAPCGEQGHKGGDEKNGRIITRRLSRRCGSLAPPPPLPGVPPRSRRAATGPGTKRGPFEEGRGGDEALDVLRAVAETGVSNEGVPVRVTRSSKRSKTQTRAGCSSEPEAVQPVKNPVAERASEGVDGGVSRYGRVRRARVKEDATRALKSESSQRNQRADRGMHSLRNLS